MNKLDHHSQPPSFFPATRWSIVVEAQDQDEPTARRALEELCQIYWYPLYVYARRSGLDPHDAEDQTQSFFLRLFASDGFNEINPEKGKLRAFLLAAMKRSLSNHRRHESAVKRGGPLKAIHIDIEGAEVSLSRELASDDSPDRAFERSWAHALLGTVYARLSDYYGSSNQAAIFAALRKFLAWSDGQKPYAEVAVELGMNEGTIRSAVHRMRARFREILEAEIRDTVATAAEAAEELQHLKRILAGR